MTRASLISLLILPVLFVLAPGVWAQEAQEQEPPPAEDEEAGEVESPPEVEEFDDIEDILEGDEAVLAGSGYSYDPGDRRDPFRSLLSAPDRADFLGPRPQGVPGMLIEEVEVTAIYITPDGPYAQVQAADKTISYLLRPGDQLFDGDVKEIRYQKGVVSEVVFKQILQDPTAIKPFRDVIKKLNP